MVLDDELCASGSVTDDEDVEYGGDRHHVDDASASSGGFECEGESLAGVHVRVEVASVEVDERAGDSDDDAELVTDAVRRWQDGSRTRLASARRVSANAYSSPLDGTPETPRLFTYSTLPTHPMHPRTVEGTGDASFDDADDEALARAMWSRSERTAGGAAVGPPPDDETEETRETEDAANFSVRGDANVRGAYARAVFPETLETPHPDRTRRSPTAAASTPVPALARRTVPRSCPRDVASPESRLAAYAAAPRRGSRQVSRTNFPRRWVAARAPESRDGKHPNRENRENRLNRFPTRLGGSHVGGSFVFVKDATNDALATRSEGAESRRGDGDVNDLVAALRRDLAAARERETELETRVSVARFRETSAEHERSFLLRKVRALEHRVAAMERLGDGGFRPSLRREITTRVKVGLDYEAIEANDRAHGRASDEGALGRSHRRDGRDGRAFPRAVLQAVVRGAVDRSVERALGGASLLLDGSESSRRAAWSPNGGFRPHHSDDSRFGSEAEGGEGGEGGDAHGFREEGRADERDDDPRLASASRFSAEILREASETDEDERDAAKAYALVRDALCGG